MAEILVKAVDVVHDDPDKDRRGCYKRGMCVTIMPDGHQWGAQEGLPKFVVIKIPGIAPDRIRKYIAQQVDVMGDLYRRREWQIRWDDLPPAARNKLQNGGELTIAAGGYSGPSDYSWTQIKQYFRNLETGLDETEDP